MKKIYYLIVFIIAIAGAAYYYTFIYAKNHHRNAQTESSIIITADSLTAAYQNNELAANKQFLNKALEVTGTIISINKDQANHVTLLIGKADAFSNVSVTLTSTSPITKKPGETITVKGVCTGNLSDVIINEGVIK